MKKGRRKNEENTQKERVKDKPNTTTRRQRHGNKSKERAEKKQIKSREEAEKSPGTRASRLRSVPSRRGGRKYYPDLSGAAPKNKIKYEIKQKIATKTSVGLNTYGKNNSHMQKPCKNGTTQYGKISYIR